jgi:tripartite-type tricarboxylate transporter receptor subunit TctC
MQTRRTFLRSLAYTAMMGCATGLAAAADYPSRPITMIVPYPPGGPTDAIGRLIADAMRPSLGQPIIIENVPGAAGSLGTERVARAAPDGYTIGLGNSITHVINAAVYPLNYDVVKDFEPISLLVDQPAVIVSKKDLPATDLRALIGWLKTNPDKGLAGTGGPGSVSDIASVFFKKLTGTSFQLVPYRGQGPAIQALMAGEIDFLMSLPANALAQYHAGTIKAFAVAAKTRLVAAPDIPTVDEAGLPGFYQSDWHALFAPKGTPAATIGRIRESVAAALTDPTVRERFVSLGQDFFPPEQLTSQALGALQLTEIEQRWPIIKAAGIKAE